MTPADLFRKATAAATAQAQYRAFSDSLLAESVLLREQGWTHWASEVEAFAVLADHAAWAEQVDPQPEPKPSCNCELCAAAYAKACENGHDWTYGAPRPTYSTGMYSLSNVGSRYYVCSRCETTR